jgi:glutathione peroxidase
MTTAHAFTFAALTGGSDIRLKDHAGRVILLVNVASQCGFTPQYRALQQLHEAKAGQGLVIIGAPCNDFGRQEPGSAQDIAGFCETTYRTTFAMTAKIDIIGANRHPLFEWLKTEHGDGALPKWNFFKYLFGKDGALLDIFPSNVTPLSPDMLTPIKKALDA